MIASASRYQAPTLRDWLQRYISHRVFLGVFMVGHCTGFQGGSWHADQRQRFGFVMEFHIPYFALRKSTTPMSDPRGLRKSGTFVRTYQIGDDYEQVHEAQISLLVAGVDEWYWTAYCCVDKYFGSEKTIQSYLDQQIDAPIGGAGRDTALPVWNPREYFLIVLSRRLRQVTWEWSSLVAALDERLESHVSRT